MSNAVAAGKCEGSELGYTRIRCTTNVVGIALIVGAVLVVLGGGSATAFVAYKKGWVCASESTKIIESDSLIPYRQLEH